MAVAKRAVKVLLNKLQGNTEEQIKFLDFLKTLHEIYKRNKTFRDLVLNEQIPLEEKEKFFEDFVGGLDITNKELAKEFLIFLAKKHAFKQLPLIIHYYQYELENIVGTLKAEIVTASELPEEIKKQLVGVLEKKLNRKVEADFKVDSELIGGFVVRTTSFVVDASVKDLLKELAMKI
jgi:F-type H+-transporting ATPase subunit delta